MQSYRVTRIKRKFDPPPKKKTKTKSVENFQCPHFRPEYFSIPPPQKKNPLPQVTHNECSLRVRNQANKYR